MVHHWYAVLIIPNGPVHRRNPHLVAIITDTAYYTLHDAFRMQRPGRKIFKRIIRLGKTENIRITNRLGTKPRAQSVANNTAHARIGATKRLKRRRMIMRLDLETNIVFIIKGNNPCIIVKHGNTPGLVQRIGRLHNG